MSHAYAEPAQERERETAASSPATQQNEVLSSRPPIACSAPLGAAQGGLLDWFRGIFSHRPEGTPEEEEVPAEVHPPADFPYLPLGTPVDEGVQTDPLPFDRDAQPDWSEDSYGPVDLHYVTMLPDKNSPLAGKVHNYDQEGPAQPPVFETHSFMPREAVDEVSAMHLHSFIGLRFTQMDLGTHRMLRKRIKVGFGGNGGPFSDHGSLLDDSETQADMSSETPISRDKLELAFATIPEEIKKPYNVISHNCNHFTQEMAVLMGATLPAKLHDTLLGPAAAYKNLANAAEYGEQNRTRFFQGGGSRDDKGQLSLQHGNDLLHHFPDMAKSAARRDGTPFFFFPSLANAANQVQAANEDMLAKSNSDLLDTEEGRREFENAVQNVARRADALVGIHLWKGHPRVNITAKKAIAMANSFRSCVLRTERPLGKYSAAELELLLTQPTEAEAAAHDSYELGQRLFRNRPEQLAKVKLQAHNDYLFSRNSETLEGAGEIFLDAMGLPAVQMIREYRSFGGEPVDGCDAIFQRIIDALTGDGGSLNQCLLTFQQGRDSLNPSQLGALAASAMVKQLENATSYGGGALWRTLFELFSSGRSIASNRANDSLDMEGNSKSQKDVASFLGIPSDQTEKLNELTLTQAKRRNLLSKLNLIEIMLAQRFQDLRRPAQEDHIPAAEEENAAAT